MQAIPTAGPAGILAKVPFEHRTVSRLLMDRAERSPHHKVLEISGTEIDWASLERQSAALASGLSAIGVRRGDVVCQMAGNTLAHVLTVFALARLGAIECPINTGLRGEPLRHVLSHSRAKVVLVESENVERLWPEVRSTKNVEVVVVRDAETLKIPGKTVISQSDLPTSESIEVPRVRPQDPATLMYTSGTTGPAKGVLHAHHFAFSTAAIKAGVWGLDRDDVLFTALPLFHANARYSTLMTACILNARAVIVDRFSASKFWQQVRDAGATEVATVGTLAPILLERPSDQLELQHRVRMVHGAGALTQDGRKEFERRFGIRVVTGFSMTETGHAATTAPDDPGRYRASGKAVPGFEIAILDDNDHPLSAGNIGEITIRPLVPHSMFIEYYRDPGATLESFRNFWFHTGDLGYIDDDGYLFWVDRKKDAIRRRGEMISSQDVEAALLAHPSVLEAAVVGVPGDLGEEEVMAVVRVTEEGAVEPSVLRAFCDDRLPDFAVPRYFRYVTTFPSTSTHKISKKELRDKGLSGDVWDGHERTAIRHR